MSKTSKDVCLVVMPYSPVEQSSIAPSILKAGLNNADITATVVYANLLWAEEIGTHVYSAIFNSELYDLLSEWTFSDAAFPNFKPDHDKYFHHIQKNLQGLEQSFQQVDKQKSVKESLLNLRLSASAFIERAARTILELQPRIVDCSSMFMNHCSSLALLRQIKELNPNIVTMMTGFNCEASMGVVTHKKCPWVDFVISGDADFLFPQLCQQVLTSGTGLSIHQLPEGVLGPAHRGNGYTQLEQFPPRAKIENINDSPTPDYDDYFTALQASSIGYRIVPGLQIETSRGCWWGEVSHCTFCGSNGDYMSYRSKTPSRVVKEFEYLSQRYQTQNFYVVDRNLDLQYFKTVIPALVEQDYNIFYETKVNLKRRQVQKLADAGIRWIQAGIESLDNTLLKKTGKGTTVHQNIQFMKWTREMGIHNLWVMLYGLPGETDDIYLKLVKWLPKISHLQPPYIFRFIQYHRFSPYHEQPALFNLNLLPHRSYSYIYPWDNPSLEKFAYFFYDDTIAWHNNAGLQRQDLRALRDCIINWRQEWSPAWQSEGQAYPAQKGVEPATLVMIDDGEQLEITDTRQCAIQPKFYLNGLSRQVYHICDKARKQTGILAALQSDYNIDCGWDTVEPIVRELCENGLLLELDGYFLSLALHTPLKPIANPTKYPGGNIMNSIDAKMMQLFKQSNQK